MAGIDGVQGSHWYFPMVTQVNHHNHYRLMSDSYERAATLGFRCVRDVEPAPQQPVQLRWSGPPPALNMLATTAGVLARSGEGLPVDASTVKGSISSDNAVSEWARWKVIANNTIHTVRPSSTLDSNNNNNNNNKTIESGGRKRGNKSSNTAAAIGLLKCAGNGVAIAANTSIASFSWDGAAAPDLQTANATTDAVQCVGGTGFEVTVAASGDGPQTLTLYGGVPMGGSLIVRASSADGAAVHVTASPAEINDIQTGVSDATFHITFEGAAGTMLNVTFALNSSSSSSSGGSSDGRSFARAPNSASTSNFTYTEYDGVNCYKGHGAVEIDVTPITNLTVDECLARCDADDTCSCVQYLANGNTRLPPGSCWKRAQCIPDKCGKSKGQTMYAKDYFVHAETNCFAGHGAMCLPANCSAAITVATKEDCIEYCEADSQCAAAVYSAGANKCWKRADINLPDCNAITRDTLLVKPTRSSARSGGRGPLLYAATLSMGSMPPLFGY